MFKVYYSNQLSYHKDLLVGILSHFPNPNPFEKETILVQSKGMEQWLRMEIAQTTGISGNIDFLYPTKFMWKQYRTLNPDLPEENVFSRGKIVWRLMRLIPTLQENPELQPLANYLQNADQLKLYQLAAKIADLFDQYLVYRPEWILHWEDNQEQKIIDVIAQNRNVTAQKREELENSVRWQGILWRALKDEVESETEESDFIASHRAYLQQMYFDDLNHLSPAERQKLPKRIFVFGISSLPLSQLEMLKKLSQHCDVYLFFTNPSSQYWGDSQSEKVLEKLALEQKISPDEIATYSQGNPLLAVWGKQGKAFLNLLEEQMVEINNDENAFEHFAENPSLLASIKRAVLAYEPELDYQPFESDNSLQIHSCHSKMREVEVLHNQLLKLFESDETLSPKDIIVMSPDIDSYAPYINAVFSRYTDSRHIPFALSDQTVSKIDPVIAGFLELLAFKEKRFSVEEVLSLLNIPAVREKFQISEEQLATLRAWIPSLGIRAGLHLENPEWNNYNSWENGIARLMLGTALKAENQVWQDVVAFDESYGLSAELSGNFAHFLENLTAWNALLQQPHTAEQWKANLFNLLEQFFQRESEQGESVSLLQQAIESVVEQIQLGRFDDVLSIEIINQLFEDRFSDERSNLHFMVGRVNFCTLLPMRAIPFKVVCLLGMNEGEFPRQQSINNFDLIQYAPQKGDRVKRDDDRYLFLEAMLSAQQIFYISYIGQSLTSNQEKLPSILVSQLLDYLQEQLPSLDICHQQPMSVFSPANFINGATSYDKEWLQAKSNQQALQDFAVKIEREKADFPHEVELDELIAYLQDPTKYFFQRHLGVKFEQYDENIEEHEVFELSNLDKYNLRDDLVTAKQSQQSYFEQAKLTGKLPHGHFGEIAMQEINESVTALRNALGDWLEKEKTLLEIDSPHLLNFNGESQSIRVQGYIQNYFEKAQIVQWRVGSLRDKDLIKAWVYHLFLSLMDKQDIAFSFHYLDKSQAAKCLTFKPVAKEVAEQLIQRYLQDYFANFSQLTTALTSHLADFFKAKLNDKVDICDKLEELLNKENSPYWQRVALQTETLDFSEMQQRTLAWFEEMVKSQEIK